jgi:hypothetical protein
MEDDIVVDMALTPSFDSTPRLDAESMAVPVI